MIRPDLRKFHIEKGRKTFALLIDPDDWSDDYLNVLNSSFSIAEPDLILIGGSTCLDASLDQLISRCRDIYSGPIYLFPGSGYQLSSLADGVLMLSMLSSRNPDLLIGKQVEAAPLIKSYGLSTLSCAYLLIDGGRLSSVQYMSQSLPIPRDKTAIGYATAIAAEMLGFESIYLEAGSGAEKPVPQDMIHRVAKSVNLPVIVGGGLNSYDDIRHAYEAGADMVVVGSLFEKQPELFGDIIAMLNSKTKTTA